MRFNYKKISAIATSVLLTGLTVSAASAVSDPADLDNPAVVYGANSADETSATGLGNYISDNTDDTTTGEVGDESFLISATGDDLTYGEALSAVTESLDDRDLSTLLAEGTLEDDSVDYGEEEEVTYFQDIELSDDSVTFNALDEDDYVVNTGLASDEEPVLYIDQSSGESYKLVVDFATAINATAYDSGESITIFGKELSFDPEMKYGDTELIMYESTETISLGAGDSMEINGDTVEVLGANTDKESATISINGKQHQVEKGDKEGDYYVNDIFMQNVPEKTASVELFVGAKEWSIDGINEDTDVEIEGETVEGVQADITADVTDKLGDVEDITFTVTPSDMDEDEKSYLEVGEALEDPLFDISMVFESVEPELKADSKGKIELSSADTADLSFTSRNGKEYDISPFELSSDKKNITAGEDWYANGDELTGLQKDDIFIANEGAGDSEETLIYQVDKINDNDDAPSVEFTELSSGSTTKVYEDKELGNTGLYTPSDLAVSSFDLLDDTEGNSGSAHAVNNELVTENQMRMTLSNEVTLDASGVGDGDYVVLNGINISYGTTASAEWEIDGDDGNYADFSTAVEEANFSDSDDVTNEATLEGYQVDTYSSSSGLVASNTASILMEEDEDDVFSLDSSNIARGDVTVNMEIDADDEEIELKSSESGEFTAVSNSDTDMIYAISELGTYYEADKDEYASIDIWTPSEGQTVYNVYVSGEVEESTSDSGSVVLKDTDDYSGRDVIIVGGSCINSAAADVLTNGQALCGEDFTAETGVGQGEFILKGSEDANGNVVVVAAGYIVDDTTKAVNKIQEEDFDKDLSSVDQIYKTVNGEEVVEAE